MNNNDTTNSGLQPLTQELLRNEELISYLPEFDLVESRKEIRNIALMGPAAANKIAVANSWKARQASQKWLTVSVPHFNGETSFLPEAEIENTLINQIVCQMSLANSPKTRFRSMMKHSRTLDIAFAAVVVMFIALSIFLVWVARLLPSSRPAPALCMLALIIWLGCIGFSVFHIMQSNVLGRLFERLKKRNNNIEPDNDANQSQLEHYMSDLVYLLDTNGHDYVIFEGLDTYHYLPLFERLRSLNALVNAKRANSKQAPIRFIYLVSDGLLDDPHERARFFDYIIPVIPFIDPASVLMQFKNGLEDVDIKVDDDFLANLSRFVDDPSILRDIVNETRHYRVGLLSADEETTNDLERLVALLTYKALFPRDFDLLQNGQGYLNALMRSRSAILEESFARIAKATLELSSRLETAKSTGEKDAIEVIQDDIDELKCEELELGRKTLSTLINEMPNPNALFLNPPYQEGLDSAHLHSIIESPYFPFVQFAVSDGWIDASYERFLSNFYAESMAADDRGLIASIVQGAPVDANRAVHNPFAIVSHLDPDAFTQKGARVFALLRHLLTYGPDNKVESFFAGLKHDNDIAWLVDYTESNSFNSSIFSVVTIYLDDAIACILSDDSIDFTRRRNFCHRLLAFGANALNSERTCEAAQSFAHGDASFLQVDCIDPISIANGLVAIEYKPFQLEMQNCDHDLLQFVYDKDLYAPVAPVIDNLISSLLETKPAIPDGFLVTRLFSLAGTTVRNNVAAEGDLFLETLLEATPVPLNDSPEAIAWICGLDSVSPERALAYLKELSDDISIERITDFSNYTYQSVLIDRALVECTPTNILGYFKTSGYQIDTHLVSLLEANSFPSDFTMVTTEKLLGSESGFLKALIRCKDLSDQKIDEITTIYRAQFNHFDITDISEKRVELLIQNGTIRTTKDNLTFIRTYFPGAARYFAQAEPKMYLRLILGEHGAQPECGLVCNEALDVFDMPDVDDAIKTALVTSFTEPVSMSFNYSNDLNAAIAGTHFNPMDLKIAARIYENGNKKLKRAIAEGCASYCTELAEQNIKLPMDMLADVAWRMRGNRGRMVRLIAQQLSARDSKPSRLEVRSVFERAGLEDYVDLIDGPTAVIPDTREDDELIAALTTLNMAGKQTGKPDWQGLRRINSKGYTRAK